MSSFLKRNIELAVKHHDMKALSVLLHYFKHTLGYSFETTADNICKAAEIRREKFDALMVEYEAWNTEE